MRFEEDILEALDSYAIQFGASRTAVIEAMAESLVEGRMGVVPRKPSEYPLLPDAPMPGSSPLYPALIWVPDE